MDEIELLAQKRAFPSRGRARINSEVLKTVGIETGADIEINIPETDKWISATAFADTLVDSGYIRLSEEDLKELGAGEGTKLRIRRKKPVTEHIQAKFQGASDAIKSASPDSIRAGAAGVAAGVGAAFSQAVEQAKKALKPSDAMALGKALKANQGEVRAVTVPAGKEIRPLSAIVIPKGVVLAAVQRGDSIQTTDPSFLLLSGDIVYLVGDESLILDKAAKMIGG
ncbi:MAG TPA: TrkA C-terminal domain-containing protein [Methanoregulaceae archaeon]|nr:TrkA C-terminal domain-containing protein [Methanoregulaceae archaeon]